MVCPGSTNQPRTRLGSPGRVRDSRDFITRRSVAQNRSFLGNTIVRALGGGGVTKNNGHKRTREEKESPRKKGKNGQHVRRSPPAPVIRGLGTRREWRAGGARERASDWRHRGAGTPVIGRGRTEACFFLNRVGFWVAKALEGS